MRGSLRIFCVSRETSEYQQLTDLITSLWELGTEPVLSSFPLPRPRKPLVAPPASEAPTEVDNITNGVASLGVDEDSIETPGPSVPEGTPLTPSEVSTLLSASLLQVLSTAPPSFPIPSSQLYSAHVLPSRPAYIPVARRDDVIINRSEWKKLAKWMKEASKDGVIKIKESKGEVVVTGLVTSCTSLTEQF